MVEMFLPYVSPGFIVSVRSFFVQTCGWKVDSSDLLTNFS